MTISGVTVRRGHALSQVIPVAILVALRRADGGVAQRISSKLGSMAGVCSCDCRSRGICQSRTRYGLRTMPE